MPAVKFAQRYGAAERGGAGGGGGAEFDLAAGLNGSSAPGGALGRSGNGPCLQSTYVWSTNSAPVYNGVDV